MITGIEHIAIFAKDTLALKTWYQEQFDFEQVYDNGKGTYFLKAADGSMLEFCIANEVKAPTGDKVSGIRHLAFSVDDFEGMVAKLKAAGVEIVTDAVVNDKGIGTFFFRDIEGNVIHLIKRVKPL